MKISVTRSSSRIASLVSRLVELTISSLDMLSPSSGASAGLAAPRPASSEKLHAIPAQIKWPKPGPVFRLVIVLSGSIPGTWANTEISGRRWVSHYRRVDDFVPADRATSGPINHSPLQDPHESFSVNL